MKKNETISVLTALEATKMQKPYYNAYICGTGLHRTSKKDRRKTENKKAVYKAKTKYCYY